MINIVEQYIVKNLFIYLPKGNFNVNNGKEKINCSYNSIILQ